jgi:hypothetical protein
MKKQDLLRFFIIFITFFATVSAVNAQTVSGKVFHDFNANGQADAGEVGMPAITITAFNGTIQVFNPHWCRRF